MKGKYLLSVLVILLGFSAVIAPDPYLHLGMVDAFCDTTDNPEAKVCCEQYRDLMYAGAMIPDSMIKDYYTMSGSNYRKMHNWGNAIDLLNRIQSNDIAGKCYAKSRIFHLVPDGVSHNKIVPDMMGSWNMPNELIHIPVEYAMGVSFLQHNVAKGVPQEEWFKKGTSALSALYDTENVRFVTLEQTNMGKDSKVDMTGRINTLIYFVGGNRFFEEGYNPTVEEEQGVYTANRLDIFWLFIGIIFLIPGLFLTKIASERNKFALLISVPMVIFGLLITFAVLMAYANKVSVISYGWRFLYKTLGGLIQKDETYLMGASLTIMDDLWANNLQGSYIIHYKGDTIDISEPHGFKSLGYGAGGTSFKNLIFWIIGRIIIIFVVVVVLRALYKVIIKREKLKLPRFLTRKK